MKVHHPFHKSRVWPIALASLFFLTMGMPAFASEHDNAFKHAEFIPTGAYITPTAATNSTFQHLNPHLPGHPDFVVGQAVTTATSPDGNTLLILTSGYNKEDDAKGNFDPAQSNEYVFVFDISGSHPVQSQVLEVPNTFCGLVWNPNGKAFYVSGGDDDNVHVFTKSNGVWAEAGTPIVLGHQQTNGLGNIRPEVAGLAVDSNGKLLVAANYENDSISLLDLSKRTKLSELDLRPGNGVAGGEYPFWVSIEGNQKAYVSSQRDREIVVVDISNPAAPAVIDRIPVKGVPNKMIMNSKQSLLYIALDNSDSVAVIDTASDQVIGQFKTLGPKAWADNKDHFNGINPNSLALSPDERTLYVTNGGANSLAVIPLARNGDVADPDNPVTGLIPTGWYPNSVSLNRSGSILYVVNGKSNTGPVPAACRNNTSTAACRAANQYVWQLTKAGFQTIPVPKQGELERLTEQVAKNNDYRALEYLKPSRMMAFLHHHIKHVIYIVKENRTYDQILGDLEEGNGDPSLAIFPEALTPNQHQLARQFVDLDNFYDSAETSGDGWNWSTAARTTDSIEKTEPVNYAGRGLAYDYEGTNRNINVGYAALAQRKAADPLIPDDPNILPGTADVSAPDDSEGDAGTGYLWNAALRAGLTVRNYGFFIDLTRYSLPASTPYRISPDIIDPHAAGVTVAYPTKQALMNITDPYFRGFDNNFPDLYRVKEWEREFAQYEANGKLPNLELVRLMHDHFGDFGTAIAGVNTPETQAADNDYAVGRIVEDIAHSKKYRNNTLIFVIEDDAQNGPDHVDAHRSIAFVAGPFVRQGVVVSDKYTTVNMMRTMDEILGIKPLGINDATAAPMNDVFSPKNKSWTFQAVVPDVLYSTSLQLPAPTTAKLQPELRGMHLAAYAKPRHNATYWKEKTVGFDFTVADDINSARFNRILWKGLKGKATPYPTVRNDRNLRRNRQALLQQYYSSLRQQAGSGSTSKTATD